MEKTEIFRFLSVFLLSGLILSACTGQTTSTPFLNEDQTQTPIGTDRASLPTNTPRSNLPTQSNQSEIVLPRYGDRKSILQINTTSENYEAFPTTADLNNDGFLDIIITPLQFQSDRNFELEILLNDGLGGMEVATSEIFLGSVPLVQHPTEVIVADFNADHQADFFVANSGKDLSPQPGFQNVLVLSNPDGKLEDATKNLPQQNDSTHSACAADIDNDNDIDLYVGNYWGVNLISPYLLINDGNGIFSVGQGLLPPTVMLDHNGYTTCAFADVNNDLSPDLVLGHFETISSTPNSEVLLNDGKGAFRLLSGALPPKSYEPGDKAQDIRPVDLNRDPFIDLFIVYERQSDESNYIQALVNNQDGTFTDETDSRLESFYLNFWPGWKATSGNPRRTLDLRDMDRDGDLDLIAKTYDSEHPEPLIFLNDGMGNYIYEPLEFSMRDGDIYYVFIDLENDGGQDLLLTLNFPPDYVEVIRDLRAPLSIKTSFLPCPTYAKPQKILTVSNHRRRDAEPMLLTGDFNTDGFDDVLITWSIWGDATTFKFDLLLNDGDGGLYRGTSDLIEGEVPELQALPAIPMVVTDFNGDDKNDLFLAIGGIDTDPFPGFQNMLMLSNKDGKLINALSNIPQQNDGPHSITSADIDLDGDVDIFVGNVGGQTQIDPQLLLNDGNGQFTIANHLLPPQLGQNQNQYTASEFVDINNDSYPDLVLGENADDWLKNTYSISGSILLVNDRNGKFSLSEDAIPPKLSPTWLALDIVSGDLNSDNFQDLIIVYSQTEIWSGRFFQLLINNQDGTFSDETETRMRDSSDPKNDYIYMLDLLDIDNDRDLDLIARNWNESHPVPYLFMNNGSGYFSQGAFEIEINSMYYTILDIDGDGGHDFVYASYGASADIFIIREEGCSQVVDWLKTHVPTPLPSKTPNATETISPSAFPFRDDFTGDLSPDWWWIGEDPSHWNLIEVPGALRIILQPGSISTEPKNFLIREAPVSDFEITTRVDFLPTSNFQFAGLLIYESQGNALQFGRAFGGIGNAIFFDNVEKGNFRENSFATFVKPDEQAYLRLRRVGTSYIGYYSEDGSNWIEIGTHESTISPKYVGLIASQAYSGETTADFDFFTIDVLP